MSYRVDNNNDRDDRDATKYRDGRDATKYVCGVCVFIFHPENLKGGGGKGAFRVA